ncbi:MAG: hypothetical protein ACLTYN_11700 [Dysosmobacter welbionis]
MVCFVAVLIKRDRLVRRWEPPSIWAPSHETAGRFAYIYAIADTVHLAVSAPVIASCCAASVLWSGSSEGEALLEALPLIAPVVAGLPSWACSIIMKKSPCAEHRGLFMFEPCVLLDPPVQPGLEVGQQKAADAADRHNCNLTRPHNWWG